MQGKEKPLYLVLVVSLSLVAASGCSWPQDNPIDPKRCKPACGAGEVCLNSACVLPDAAAPDARHDGPVRVELGRADLPVEDASVADRGASDLHLPDVADLGPDTCTPCTSSSTCDDGDPCTINFCGPGGCCMSAPAKSGTSCDDKDPCTVYDVCDGKGGCKGKTSACTCIDGLKNGAETDVDCGGGACNKCKDGKGCKQLTDCLSGVCTAGKCNKGCKHQPVVKDCKLDSTVGLTFCTIPSGCFQMGSPDGSGLQPKESCRSSNETQHQVTLTHGFHILSTEVTQDQFFAVMGYKPWSSTPCGGTCPVETVSWYEAAAYANALSAKAGLTACYTDKGSGKSCTKDTDCNSGEVCQNKKTCIKYDVASAYSGGSAIYTCPGYRLPTDAEWEYAYRAGTTTAYYNGNNDPNVCITCSGKDAKLDAIGWYCANSDVTYPGCSSKWGKCQGPHPVGKKTANAWGLYDMAGNVWEWCHDWYTTYPSTSVTDPVGASGSTRVSRGGSWRYYAWNCRAAARGSFSPGTRAYALGFRLARSVP